MNGSGFLHSWRDRLRRSGQQARRILRAPAPTRPTVLFHSDDWGRTGLPDAAALQRLAASGVQPTGSPWERYGLETTEDLEKLGDILSARRDADGRNPVFSALFIMANADLPRMRAEGYGRFHATPITTGFPSPWQQECLMPAYRDLLARGVFLPGLHGYTHFNAELMLQLAVEQGPRGERIRALHAQGIPYLASLTPEYNFALLERAGGSEHFISREAQSAWLQQGVDLFRQGFGYAPTVACAPGYRFNDTTCALWHKAGITVAHSAGGPMGENNGCWLLPRNVFFEPVLQPDALVTALAAAQRAVMHGEPIVICTHSINYVSRFVNHADAGRAALGALLDALLARYPDLRFADDPGLLDSWQKQDSTWWREPGGRERLRRSARSMPGARP